VSGFLLDTNVISEVVRPRPDPRVSRWIETTEEELLFVSAMTVGEIRKGITALTNETRKAVLETWFTGDLLVRFEGRILPIDQVVAERWGRLAGTLAKQGFPLSVVDGLLASSAMQHNLTLVTRNTRDVIRTGVTVLDPWTT
jgi:predicted nucleic acid-binding protein